MARPLRMEVPDGIYHAWNRGVNRADIVFDDRDRQFFVDLLPEVIRRFGWIVHEFVLMTNHFHLIFSTPDPTLSRGMKWLEQKFAQHINHRYGRVGPLYQGRFKAQLVESGSYLLTVLRYVALNPMRAGMVERPEEYRWSSYRWLAGFEEAPAWFKPGAILESFGPDLATQQREFRKFTEAGAGITRAPWLDAIGQIFIGSQEWVESMRSIIESKPRSTSRVSELIAECDRDLDRKEHTHLRIAIDRCVELLRREMKPVMPRFREIYPSASRFA